MTERIEDRHDRERRELLDASRQGMMEGVALATVEQAQKAVIGARPIPGLFTDRDAFESVLLAAAILGLNQGLDVHTLAEAWAMAIDRAKAR